MNQNLSDTLRRHGIETEKLTPEMGKLFSEINETYELLDKHNNVSDSNEINELNKQLRQESAYHYLIINNLKSAIASLESDSEILQTNAHESDDINYLTNSLIQLVTTQKNLNRELLERARQLEEINILLSKEKEKLAKEKAQDSAILFAIADGLVVTNLKGEIILVNNSFEQLLNVPRDKVIGKRMSEIVILKNKFDVEIPEENNIRYLSMRSGQKYSTPLDTTHYYIRRDGKKFPVRITIAPIIMANQIVGSVEIFRDITKEEELNKAKNEFVSIASHQLRTPLSAINWYTELLLEDKKIKIGEENENYLSEIVKAKDRMSDIINALLDVSRIELGTFKVNPEIVKIDDIIRTIIKDHQPSVLSKSLKVDYNNSTSIDDYSFDTRLITIILQNIIGNAIKYTPTNGQVSINLSIDTSNQNQLLVEVKDTGMGIPDKDKKNIFSKMFRADNIRKIDTDGNGLGLYIVKSILDVVKGKIWFESKEGKGSTFYCLIPTKWEKRN
jgi:PAS domain S-box-containing protein